MHNLDPNRSSAAEQQMWKNRRTLLEGVVLGVFYGVFLRLAARPPRWFHIPAYLERSTFALTISFLCLGPLVMGLITVFRADEDERTSVLQWICYPWLTVLFMLISTDLLLLEGTICIIMASPIAFIFGSLGGLIAGVIGRRRRLSNRTVICVALVPFLVGPLEARINPPLQTRTVNSQIRIHASPVVVWENIEHVSAIAPSELRPNWTHRIGFPRPIEATLSYEGVGGVRHATFERGLLFIETVTAWEPQRRLAFTIKADNANIPSTTLDEHVTIGGRYFDVLNGEYSLEPVSGGDVILHLTSHQRLSTNFNGYSGLWTDAVMQSLQTSILEVIQHRCEQTGKTALAR